MDVKCFLLVVATLLATAQAMVREGWFETRVDHFNPRNQDRYSMRYYINDEHSYAKGPIFIVVGSFGAVDTRLLSYGHFYDIAYQENAYMFASELRYFGHSHPVPNAELENMDFLSVDQALADLAEFVAYVRNNVVHNPDAKVILLGTGYGGSLATWFRQKYPHLVKGIWVSSGALETDFSFIGYNEALGNSIRQYGSDSCFGTIWSGFRVAQNLAALGYSELLTREFHLCNPLDTDDELEVKAFFHTLRENIEVEILHLRNTRSITEMCEEMDLNGTSLDALATWFAREHQFVQCVNMDFNSFMAPYLDTDFNSEVSQIGYRQRLYIHCTQEGFFPTTAHSEEQPFGNMIDAAFFAEVCQRAFGPWLTEEIINDLLDSINTRFGGRNPAIDHVHFTNGAMDPYHLAGILEDLGPDARASLIPGAFITPDIDSIDYEYDSEEVIAAKLLTRTKINIWLYEDFEPITGTV